MCVAALSLATGLMQSVASFAGQQAEYDARAHQWTTNYVNTLAAGRDQMGQLQQRQLQEAGAFAQKEHLGDIEEAQKTADATVQASDAGVSGVSVDGLIADITRKASYNRQKADAIPDKELSQIDSVERPTAPNPLTMVVGFLGSGVKYMQDTEA